MHILGTRHRRLLQCLLRWVICIMTNQIECDVLFIPAGLTSLLQPVDVSINKPFKDRIRHNRLLFQRVMRYPSGSEMFQPNIFSQDFKTQCQWLIAQNQSLQHQNRFYAAMSVSNSWQGYSEDTILHGWRHIGISRNEN